MTDRQEELLLTMEGLEQGLHVSHIATFEMQECSLGDTADRVFDDHALTHFDQFPVRENGHVVGVLDKTDLKEGATVAERMRPLSEGMLISAGDTIETLLPLMASDRYRLVVRRGGIHGIVTRSDLLKLPVRLYAFTKITHLELLMADLIRTHLQNFDHWMKYLTESRQQGVREKMDQARDANLDVDELEYTELADKREILRKHLGLGNRFKEELRQVEKLRNTLFHAGDYARTPEDLQDFISRLGLVDEWAGRLSSRKEERSS